MTKPELQYISERELCERLGVSLPTVRRLRERNADFPPAVYITPSLPRFEVAALDAWLRSRAVQMTAKIARNEARKTEGGQ